MTATAQEIAIDAYVIALDETEFYSLKPAHRPHVKAIRGVYLFDRNTHTHCCELTPSYYLIHVYDEVIPADDTPDELRELLDSEYAYCGGEDKYVHTHAIDRILSEARPFTVHHYGDPGVSFDDVERDEQMDALREHFQGNHAF
jgi:hypothetical protein